MLRGFLQRSLFLFSGLLPFLGAVEYGYITNNNSVSKVDLSTQEIVQHFSINESNPILQAIAITPNYKYLVVCAFSCVYKINIASGAVTPISDESLEDSSFVAITPDGLTAIVSCSNNIAFINLATDDVSYVDPNEYNIGQPAGIAITPDGQFAFVANVTGNNLLVIAVKSKSVWASINSHSFDNPLSISITSDGSKGYVTNYKNGIVSVIDVKNQKWIYDIGGFTSPSLLAISPDGKKAYVTSDPLFYDTNQMFFVDLTKGSQASPIPITLESAEGTLGLAFNNSGEQVYVCQKLSNQQSKVITINTSTNNLQGSGIIFKDAIYIAITPIPYPPKSLSKSINLTEVPAS
jgi:YVTN family beta-propeller protein